MTRVGNIPRDPATVLVAPSHLPHHQVVLYCQGVSLLWETVGVHLHCPPVCSRSHGTYAWVPGSSGRRSTRCVSRQTRHVALFTQQCHVARLRRAALDRKDRSGKKGAPRPAKLCFRTPQTQTLRSRFGRWPRRNTGHASFFETRITWVKP